MNNKIMLGSPFEISLRILLMLDELKGVSLDEQRMCAIDFIAVYASDFNLLDENLHGYGNYRFSEYPARKDLVVLALKTLVLNGTVIFLPNNSGFSYKISPDGEKICKDMTNSYADEYQIAIRAVLEHYDVFNDSAMLRDINQHTIRYLKEDYHE